MMIQFCFDDDDECEPLNKDEKTGRYIMVMTMMNVVMTVMMMVMG